MTGRREVAKESGSPDRDFSDAASVPPVMTGEPRASGRLDEQLQELIAEHGEAVYRVARSIVRDNALAEDVAQEALLKAWQSLSSFRGEAPLRSWVLRITHNTAISLLRKRRDVVVDPVTMPEAPTLHDTERRAESRLLWQEFERALGELDELSRSVVVLRELERLSYDEIAEILDVPLPTVKTRLMRARRVLSHTLEGHR